MKKAARASAASSLIEMPLMGVYAACIIARQEQRNTDYKILDEVLVKAGNTAGARDLAVKALTGMPESIIPFVRDEIDIHAVCAAVAYATTENYIGNAHYRFYSDASLLYAGYFEFKGGKCLSYVDRFLTSVGKQVAHTELFPKNRLQELLRWVQSNGEIPVVVTVPANASFLLEFESTALETLVQSAAAFQVKLTLVQSAQTKNARGVKRQLTSASLKRQSAGVYSLTLKPEHTMEIHAAAFAGQWLLIEVAEMRLLTPLPDFDLIGARINAWFQPSPVLSDASGLHFTPTISLKRELAESVMRRHRWFGAVDVIDWFSAIQQTT